MRRAEKYYQLRVPCKAYIRKFVAWLYGSDVLLADQYTALGFMVKMALEKNIYEKRHLSNSAAHKGMDDHIIFQINDWQFFNLGFDLSPENVLIINSFLEQQFKEQLFQFCETHTKENGFYRGHNKAIEQFARKVGIDLEYDIPFDSMKKMEYRHRMAIERRKLEQVQMPQLFAN